jgi:CHRD domain-containing protein
VTHRLITVAASGLAAAGIAAGVASAQYDEPSAPERQADALAAQSAYMTGTAVPDEDGVADSDGKGSATFLHVDARTVCYGFTVTGTGTPTAIAIYKGAEGETGRTVVPFSNLPKGEDGEPAGDPGTSSGCKQAANAGELAALKRIRKAPENYYLLMKTEDFPGGAIRGQLAELGYGTER